MLQYRLLSGLKTPFLHSCANYKILLELFSLSLLYILYLTTQIWAVEKSDCPKVVVIENPYIDPKMFSQPPAPGR